MSVKEFGSVVLVVIFWPLLALWTMLTTCSRALEELAFGGLTVWTIVSVSHLTAGSFGVRIELLVFSYVLCHTILGIIWCLWMVFASLTIPDDAWCDTEFEIAS